MSTNEPHDHLVWRETNRKTILDASIFQVHLATRRSRDGRETAYTLVDSPDWCNVIAPYTREDGVECFVMARQFRQGSGTVTLEFPGGLVDEGEEIERAALRELEEETGFTADRVVLIGKVNPNPAFMTNAACTYAAEGVRPASAQRLDENELVDVVLVPRDEIIRRVPSDFHIHAIMLSALYWFTLYEADGMDYATRLSLQGSA